MSALSSYASFSSSSTCLQVASTRALAELLASGGSASPVASSRRRCSSIWAGRLAPIRAVVTSVWLALFYDMREALFMSMREEDVDDRTPSSLMGKARFCLNNLPEWMRAGWVEGGANDNSMKLLFPETKSSIKGILSRGTAGRSGRATVCFNDEFAFVEDSTAVLAALSELSNSKIYLSTANGAGNEFYRMADDPATNKKTFHWTLHPLKNEESQRLKRNEPDMT